MTTIMKIKINSTEYSIESAMELLGINESNHTPSEQVFDSNVFDKYGNFAYPTETNFSETNDLRCSVSRSFLINE